MSDVLALQSMFEGLYVRALKPTGAFKAELLARGYDLDRQHSSYPLQVWNTCVECSIAELYPELGAAQAWETMGRRFIEGYLQTLVGRMIGTMLPFMNPRMFVSRVPRFITTGLENAEVTLEWKALQVADLTLYDVHPHSASLMMGVMGFCFERMKAPPVLMERQAVGPNASAVRITLTGAP